MNKDLVRLSVEDFKRSKKTPILVVLDSIRSLLNVGSIFRTCDAFLVEKIYLCGLTGCPPHRDINKTALGATETVDWAYHENIVGLLTDFQQQGFQIVPIEQAKGSVTLSSYHPKTDAKLVVVFGNEVGGVSQEVVSMADEVIEVPQFGTKHSLNVSVCVGIVLWDVFLKLQNS